MKTKKLLAALEFLLLLTSVAVVFNFYYQFDPKEMLTYGVFPWDSATYRQIAEQIASADFTHLSGTYPFATRLAFPAIYGFIAHYFNLQFIQASFYLNLFSSTIVVLFTYYYWKENGVKKVHVLGAILFFMLFSGGPLRYSIFYPSGGFAFECLCVCLFFFTLQRAHASQSKLEKCVLLPALIVVLSLAREFVLLMLIIYIVFYCITKKYRQNLAARSINSAPYLFTNQANYFRTILLLFATAFITALLIRLNVKNIDGGYSMFGTAITFGWFHLHVGESLYPLFYALGPFTLCVFCALAFKNTRTQFFERIKYNKDLPLFLLFCLSALVFAFFGGTDSDRFLLWFFPFLGLIGLYAFESIIVKLNRKIIFTLFLLIISLCWSRAYVPSAPHIFFVGNYYNAYGGIKTDLSPSLYYGPDFMQQYRYDLQTITIDDINIEGIHIDRPEEYKEYKGQISKKITRDNNKLTFHRGGYKNDLNNIPFPLGFPHNQYEFLAAHPYHGSEKIRIFLLLEWVITFVLLAIFIKKDFRLAAHYTRVIKKNPAIE